MKERTRYWIFGDIWEAIRMLDEDNGSEALLAENVKERCRSFLPARSTRSR